MPARRDPKEAFEEKFIPEPNSGCWLWEANAMKSGYGRFGLRNPRRCELAHRAAWIIYRGSIPENLFVLHRCDNRACVNPEHLFLGTHTDNMSDMTTKGRQARGERMPQTRLTEQVVLAIIRDRRRINDIAFDYDVSKQTISRIKNGTRWAHISNGSLDIRKDGERHYKVTLTQWV